MAQKKLNLSREIDEVLSSIPGHMQTAIDEAAVEMAKEAVKELKRTSPKKTGEYAKSWKYKKMSDGRVVIYNKKYFLTHLLEHGHAITKGKRAGERVEGRPHIEPVQKMISEKFPERVKILYEEVEDE